jgi:hypothetical protein
MTLITARSGRVAKDRVEFGIENGAKVDTMLPQADNSKKRRRRR